MKLALCLALLSAPAAAQSINIDFGTPGTAPSGFYPAAGRPGTWNNFGVVPGTPQPLVGLWGQPITATIYNSGGTALLSVNNPATSGDDKALMDDMFLSYNNPTDLCLFFQGLQNGTYDVLIYAMNPDNTTQNRTRVDNATPGPTMVGGAWPGHHQLGVTYSQFRITTNDGTINAHSGEAGANIRSGINGIQLILLSECYANCDGSTTAPLLNVNDFVCFQARFAAGNPLANCDHSSTPPILNVNDFVCFQAYFANGCP